MSGLRLLIRKRGYLRSQITKAQTGITNTIDSMSDFDQRTYLLQLEQVTLDVKKFDDLLNFSFEADGDFDVDAEMRTRDEYRSKLTSCVVMVKSVRV